MNDKSLFNERQGFLSNWLLVGLFLIALAFFFYRGGMEKWSIGGIIGLLVFVGAMIFLLSIRLCTRIDEIGIHVDFKPFVWNKTWRWEDVEHAEVKRYSLWDYGGWGYRVGKDGLAYTTRGRYGFQVKFKNGKKILIGTQRPQEVQEVLQNRAIYDEH